MQFSFSVKNKNDFSDQVVWDLLIIGGGPAGLNAALYAKRKGLHVGLIAYEIGGQLHNTREVDNYLGFQLIEGSALSNHFDQHIESLEVDKLLQVSVEKIEKKLDLFYLHVSNQKIYKAKTVLITTGSMPKKLNISGEEQYQNKGVSYCAICDGPFFKHKHVIVAGGGNSAVEAALDLAKVVDKVTIIHRSQFRADHILLEKMKQNAKIDYYLESQIQDIYGEAKMQGVHFLDKKTNQIIDFKADGIFIEIGTIPNSKLVKELVQVNAYDEVIVDDNQMTSLEGLFAAGDITSQPFKQIIIAAGEGAKAALSINKYLQQK